MTEEYAEAGDLYEMRASLSRVFEEIVESRKGAGGVYISPETALYSTAVLACVRVLSESIAAMPFNVYRRIPGGGKEIAEDHPLQEVLAYQPNDWMTSFEWREWCQSQILLWGNSYCLIKPGRRGAVDQLIPILDSLKIPFIIVIEAEFDDVLFALESSVSLQSRVSFG